MGDSGAATYKFKEDGKPVVLTTRVEPGAGSTPILFAKKLSKMHNVLAQRGVDVGVDKVENDLRNVSNYVFRIKTLGFRTPIRTRQSNS